MMVICVCVLTIAHPGLTLGARWNTGEFHWRLKRYQREEKYHNHQRRAPAEGTAKSKDFPSGTSSEHGGTSKEGIAVGEAGGLA